MRKIELQEVWEILNRLYDSEINIAISSFWDWWYNYTLEVKPYFEQEINNMTDMRDITEVLQIIIQDVLEKYPNSTFAEWFNK